MDFLLKFIIYVAFTFFLVFLIALFFLAISIIIFTAIAAVVILGFGIYFLVKKLLR